VNRFLVTWRNRSLRRTFSIGLLTATEEGFRFSYLPGASTAPDFRPFVNFPELERQYRSTSLFPFFAQRVMDSRRPDYLNYLQALALPPGATATDVLGRANGQRKGDTVQAILEPHIDEDGRIDHVFLVSGVRHAPGNPQTDVQFLRPGSRLVLEPEPQNPANPDALLISREQGHPIGWVPDALLYLAREVAKGSYQLEALRVNGAEWPSHLRVIVRLTGAVLPGFEPFPALGTLTPA
jgi:hypothetical protein